MPSVLALACALATLPLPALAQDSPRPVARADLRALAWRSVGPSNMGGRVADIALAPSDPRTFYVAYATGGLFKSTNRGTSLTPVFDREATTCIGSVAVADAPPSWPGWAAEEAALTQEERAAKEQERAKARERDPDAFTRAENEKGRAKIVWVGTGEGNNRNSSSWGHGVYRSTDAGATWTHLGLEATHNIPQLAIDPRDPDTCYVAAMGQLWSRNPERGLYKTSDAGKSWTPVLQIDDATGCCDVVIDPKNPDTLYAAMYRRIRTAWSYESGSDNAGIFRSADAGKSWARLTNGLPARSGRIGLALHAANPSILAAIVESDDGGWGTDPFDNISRSGGVFRSEDAGDSWTRLSNLTPRSFYFSRIAIDPKDPNRVYLPGWTLWTSDDAGKTFREHANRKPHVDYHAFEINPDDTDHLLMGTDGGAYQSFDRGASWQFIDTVAVGQFYNIALDLRDPYRIAGGLQDNGTWLGANRSMWDSGPEAFMGSNAVGITSAEWKFISGGDGFHAAFELAHPKGEHDYFYSESQGGYLVRTDLTTGVAKRLRPSPKEGQPRFRFNWNSPFFISPHDHTTLYLGGNYVFRLTERGERWERISEDLSTRDLTKVESVGSEAETHGTVVSLAESELARGAIWAGTDDGRIHLTTDAGAAWRDVTPPAVAGRYVARLEPSRFDPARAYAAIDGHRSGDYAPLLLVTRDSGATWDDITGDLPRPPEGACTKVIREDRQNPDVLYCGTERGIFVTLDAGSHWITLAGAAGSTDKHARDPGPSLPHVPVDDILQHPRTLDLVIATHGRSIYIMDDASALGQLTPDVAARPLHAFTPRDARPRVHLWYDGTYGDNFFTAGNPPPGAIISYWLRDEQDEPPTVTIADAQGRTVRTLTGDRRAGINRVEWDLQADPKERIPNPAYDTSFVPAGNYDVTITLGAHTSRATLTVLEGPAME